jgi:hypothetical protein
MWIGSLGGVVCNWRRAGMLSTFVLVGPMLLNQLRLTTTARLAERPCGLIPVQFAFSNLIDGLIDQSEYTNMDIVRHVRTNLVKIEVRNADT